MKSSLVVLMLAIVAAGCGAVPDESVVSTPGNSAVTTTTLSNLGGDGLPVQQPGESYVHSQNRLTGSMMLEANGCWTADLGDGPRLVVYPEGFATPGDDGAVMEGPDGVRFASGVEFDAIGGIVAADTLPGNPGGFWGTYLDFCRPDRQEVIVLDSLVPAFQPHSLDDKQLVDLLAAAELSVSWGCGLGFTLSSVDQTVSLSVHPVNEELIAPPVALPSPDWEAVAIVGKNLMVDNCDDVVEGWEPSAEVVARWPVAAGTLIFEVPADIHCAGATVEATLRDIAIETAEGVIRLGDLDVINTAYGCFAG